MAQPTTTGDRSTVAHEHVKPVHGATHNYMRWMLVTSANGEGLCFQVYSTTGTNYDSYCTRVIIATNILPRTFRYMYILIQQQKRCENLSISRGGNYPTALAPPKPASCVLLFLLYSEQELILGLCHAVGALQTNAGCATDFDKRAFGWQLRGLPDRVAASSGHVRQGASIRTSPTPIPVQTPPTK